MTEGPTCKCPDCYRDWADGEIERLQSTVHDKDELIAAVWEVNRSYYDRLKETDKQRLMAEGRLEQIRLTWEMLLRTIQPLSTKD